MNRYYENQETNHPMVNNLIAFLRLCEADPKVFIEECLSIKTKDQKTVLLKFNTAQSMIYDESRC
jgi:hypothetical protein